MPEDPDKPNRRPRRRGAPGAVDGGPRGRRSGRGRVVLLTVLVVLLVLLVSLRGIAAFYTDKLWFESLGLGTVWSTALGTRISLALLGAGVFFSLCWANMVIAERFAPVFRPVAPADDLIERYHDLVGHRAALVRLALAVFLAVLFGVSLGANWNEWLLFRNRVDFGETDATFGVDIGFYVFQLPFITAALSWLFSVLVVVLFTTLLVHVVNGGIRFHTQLERTTPQVKAHVSVLLGMLALVQAVRYWVGRYHLTFSTRGTVDGATYTDVNVELRATYLLVLIALFAFGLFIANIWRRGWTLPVLAVGLWMFVAALAGGIVPAFVQRFRVEPSESSMEAPYILDNIAATRAAYGLDVDTETFEWDGALDSEALGREVETLQNVRLWDPAIIETSFERQQQLKGFYEINDVDVDRYVIDGQVTPVMISARDLDTAGVQQSSWEATHLAFTHGYGVVAAKANDRSASGDPDLVVSGIPVSTSGGMPEVDDPGIYFGEDKTGYVIVDTDRKEIDYQDAENQSVTTTYQGTDGVRLGSGLGGFVRRAAFALRFGDVNPLVSGNIRPESRVLIERDISGRLHEVAPFLAYDHDPYVVVTDGSVKYVVDAYTSTRNYPNAQRADTGGLGADSGLRGRSFNYARNSVKAVVDAYDGTVTMYVIDPNDPVVQAWRSAFPTLFTDGAEVEGTELEAHFRYPQELFRVQTAAFARYHLTDPDQFYEQTNGWSVAQDPGRRVFQPGDQSNTTPITNEQGIQVDSRKNRVSPYFVQMSLPDEDEEQFLLLRSFVPFSEQDTSQNLTAFMVAGSDPGQYGKLTVYQMPSGEPVEGPSQVASQMESDEAISQRLSLLNVEGTTVRYGDLLLIPIEESILYVRPVFLQSDSNPIPVLANVIVDNGSGRPIMRTTLREALIALYVGDDATLDLTTLEEERPDAEVPDSGNPDGTGTSSTTTSSTTSTTAPDTTATTQPTDGEPKTVDQLLLEAQTKFDLADAVLREQGAAGLDEYLALVADGQALVRQAIELNNLETAVPTGESTTTTAPPAESTTTVPGG